MAIAARSCGRISHARMSDERCCTTHLCNPGRSVVTHAQIRTGSAAPVSLSRVPRPVRRTSRSSMCSIITCQAGAAEKLTVAVTGATGFIGSRLVSKLTSQGHKVRVLTRNSQKASSKLPYPGVEVFGPNDWSTGVAGCTAVVNLAGEPIATRWDPALKAAIKDSRIACTTRVVDAIKKLPSEQRPKVLVSASAVGFYGSSQTATFNEDSQGGSDYLAQVCREWEGAAKAVEPAGVRLCILRIGIVLAREGGALGKMLPIFQMFAGGPLGSGRQWMSWIHRDDLIDLIIESLTNSQFSGTFNATAPKPVRMSELCSALGNILGRPSWLPVPDFALQTLLGEGASVVLDGQCVLPARTQQAGFAFKFADVHSALRNVLR